MSRTEDNANMIMYFAEEAEIAKSGTYEEMVTWNLGAISSFLMDISKSMAMTADNIERIEKKYAESQESEG